MHLKDQQFEYITMLIFKTLCFPLLSPLCILFVKNNYASMEIFPLQKGMGDSIQSYWRFLHTKTHGMSEANLQNFQFRFFQTSTTINRCYYGEMWFWFMFILQGSYWEYRTLLLGCNIASNFILEVESPRENNFTFHKKLFWLWPWSLSSLKCLNFANGIFY